MSYIIFGSVIVLGIVALIISYIRTPDVKPIKPSTKLVNTDISLEKAMEELKLVNEIVVEGDKLKSDSQESADDEN